MALVECYHSIGEQCTMIDNIRPANNFRHDDYEKKLYWGCSTECNFDNNLTSCFGGIGQ